MADLYWFPFFAEAWLSSPARITMLPEQRGAYIDLLAIAWGNGQEPPSLPADDGALAALSGLTTRWKKLGGLVREQFTEAEGRLYNAKLSAVWNDQQARYAKLAKAGRRGGETKALKKRSASDATRVLDEGTKHIELEEAVEAPKGLLPASAPDGALALEGARAPALLNDGSSRPWLAADVVPPDQAALEAEYFQRLATRADQWATENPDDAVALEAELRGEMGLPQQRELSDFQKRAYRDQFLEAVRELKKWPASEEWIRVERARLATHPIGNADRAANDTASEAADD